jgi:hypothetical protein
MELYTGRWPKSLVATMTAMDLLFIALNATTNPLLRTPTFTSTLSPFFSMELLPSCICSCPLTLSTPHMKPSFLLSLALENSLMVARFSMATENHLMTGPIVLPLYVPPYHHLDLSTNDQPYTNNDVTVEILAMYLEHPVLFGGATGNGGFDLINFGSIKDSKLAADPNNNDVTCLLYQLATHSIPSSLNGVITPTFDALTFITTNWVPHS